MTCSRVSTCSWWNVASARAPKSGCSTSAESLQRSWIAPRCPLLDPVHDRPQLVDEVVAAVTRVPDRARAGRPDRSTRANSVSATGASNQWKPCATVIASRVAAGERELLGGRRDQRDAGAHRGEGGAHPVDRLDRDERRAERRQEPGELAGARGDVHDARRRARCAGARRATPPRRAGSSGGPARRPPRPGIETGGGYLVDGHAAIIVTLRRTARAGRSTRRGGRTPSCRSPDQRPARASSPSPTGPGAGPAADRGVAALGERVHREVAVPDVALDVEVGPRGERVDLHQAARLSRRPTIGASTRGWRPRPGAARSSRRRDPAARARAARPCGPGSTGRGRCARGRRARPSGA